MNLSEIQTERIILLPLTPARIHELFETKPKEEIMAFLGIDEASFGHYQNMHEGGMETNRYSHHFFLLIDKEFKTPMGECGFHTWDRKHHRAELFYLLRKDEYKNKGYMSEVLKTVLDFGFKEMKLHRIKALVADWNEPSVKLLKKFGFTFEGTMREDYLVDGKFESSDCYSLLVTDPI
jgi:ribosomal-protein-alanine N-acetyltransferase